MTDAFASVTGIVTIPEELLTPSYLAIDIPRAVKRAQFVLDLPIYDDTLTDIIADVLHLAESQGLDPAEILSRAERAYLQETEGQTS